ncbi:MAG: PrsW family intramembrane metalloprotease [Anaerolineaceae bacterium]|nr:MAG: PrsW family intramembrane metalloprotease [Anaerolineaceae bacterium]
MEQTQRKDWMSIVLAGFCALAILVFLAGGILALVRGIANLQETGDASLSLLPAFLAIAALILLGALIGRTGWLALRQIQGKPAESAQIPPLSIGKGLVFFGGWILSIVAAAFLNARPTLGWFSLPFYLLAIGLPVYGLIRLGLGGLGSGSKLRAWGTLSAGMTVAPFLSGLIEGLVILIIVVMIAVFMGLDQQRLAALQALAEQLKNVTTQEQILALVMPYLTNPLTLVMGLFLLSVVTPLVEETAKSLPVWAAWRKLESPAQGFALGALSGAGFGLVEGLLVSASPNATWGTTLAVRAASSAMHIITSGLVGWGLGKAAQQKRALPALGGYLLGISIHGIWNACVVIMVYASTLILLSGATPNIVAALVAMSVLCFLGLLILLAPIVLWIINHQLRKSRPAAPAAEFIEPAPMENVVI